MMKLFNCDCLDVLGSQTFIEMTRDKKIILVSDPPYNMGYHYASYDDNMPEEEYFEWLGDIFGRGWPFVVIHYPESLYKLFFQIGRFPDRIISWIYNSNTPRQHRDIAFCGVTPEFSQVTQPYKNITDKRIQARIQNGKTGCKIYDWFQINQVKNVSQDKTDHPCQIPIKVMENIIGLLPKMDKLVVVDPFMGSGTTAVACWNKKVDFIGCEIDETYFEIAEERIKQETAQLRMF